MVTIFKHSTFGGSGFKWFASWPCRWVSLGHIVDYYVSLGYQPKLFRGDIYLRNKNPVPEK